MKSSTHALGSGTKKFNEKYSLHETNRYLTICTLLLKWFIRFLFSLRYVSLLMMTLAIYYYYLNSLYLIDEVAQVDRLRELMLYEKTTILVKADNKNEKTVKSFVEYYSLCRSVHEIVVVWDQQQSPPLVPSYFTFAHTHSKVKFHHIGESSLSGTSYSQFMYDHRLVDTESVMFLDPNVYVECDDLAFSINVWSSANTSTIGYFPRLHRLNSRGEATYEGPMSVWLSGQYSLLLPAGAILSKQYLWETSQETTPLLQLLRKSPQCVSIAFGLYPLVHKATAPVWIDVPVNLKGHTNTVISSQEASECLKRVAESLPISLDGITLSQHKASRARNHVFW